LILIVEGKMKHVDEERWFEIPWKLRGKMKMERRGFR